MDLKSLFHGMQSRLLADLDVNRALLKHPVSKGDSTEADWHALLRQLPARYAIDKAFVVDSDGNSSDFIDLLIYDRQYCPLLFTHQGQHFIPAESVYAVFEIKQDFSAKNIAYAGKKVASARRLKRTSAQIPHAGGMFDPKPLFPIIGGILALDCDWVSPFGTSFKRSLLKLDDQSRLDVGCCLKHGAFSSQKSPDGKVDFKVTPAENSLVSFFLDLFQRLQSLGTVPAIDLGAYTRSL